MKITHYPGKAVMEDPWLSINDRTMDLVYAANWVGARNLSNYDENDSKTHKVKYNTISRSKSCRDIGRSNDTEAEDNVYHTIGTDHTQSNDASTENISQLAKYQQNIEEARENNNYIAQNKLKHSYSFKDMPNGYKPSTLRRVKRRNFTEWDIESFGEKGKQPPVPPQRKDSLKYAHRQRKLDKKNHYPIPDPGPVPPDPSSESYYEYYSRVSQQANDTDTNKLKQIQKDNNKDKTPSQNGKPEQNSSAGFNNDTVYQLINTMATLDLTPMKQRSGTHNSNENSEAEDLGLYMRPINGSLSTCNQVPDRTMQLTNERIRRIEEAKPGLRSKSLRVKSEGRAPLRPYLETIQADRESHNGVTVTQPKRNLSPSEQLTLMQYEMFNGSSKIPPVPPISNGFHSTSSAKESDYRTMNGVAKQIKRDKYGKLYNTVRVKSDNRYNRYNDLLFEPPRERSESNGNGVYSRSAKSSSSGSDSDFSIPRPKLIVPVHTYGTRKRRTGNLCQRDSNATDASLDSGVLLDVNKLEETNGNGTALTKPQPNEETGNVKNIICN